MGAVKAIVEILIFVLAAYGAVSLWINIFHYTEISNLEKEVEKYIGELESKAIIEFDKLKSEGVQGYNQDLSDLREHLQEFVARIKKRL